MFTEKDIKEIDSTISEILREELKPIKEDLAEIKKDLDSILTKIAIRQNEYGS